MNLDDIFKKIDKNELVLPDFQRNFVWKKDGQRALAASVLLNFPIGSFLILEGKKEDFATKKLGFSTEEAEATNECEFLLDGQQRITSLRTIFNNPFNNDNWKDTLKGMYNSLRTKWYLRIIPNDNEDDVWGWKNLLFDEQALRNIEPSQLENMIIDETIGLTKTNNWYNPDYILVKEDGEKIDKSNEKKYLLGIAKKISDNNLIPLSIYDKESQILLKYSLDYIASEREKELKAEYSGNFEKIEELLSNAEIIYDDINNETVDSYMLQLKTNWICKVSNYLNNILINTSAEVIKLKSNEIGRAVIIFERINKGGTNLDNFDLVVARAARDKTKESLTKRIINHFSSDMKVNQEVTSFLKGEIPDTINLMNMQTVKDNEIDSIIKNQYLNLLSILSYVNYGEVDNIKIDYTKKDKILSISYENINNLTDKVLTGISRACQFLHMRCGIININDLHYKLMILPIAYVLLDDNVWNNKKCLDKIEYWYWGSIFAGEYRLYPNQTCIDDVKDLYNWVNKGLNIQRYIDLEKKVFDIKEFSDSDTLINQYKVDVPAAIYKGILQYELSNQPHDLLYSDIMLNTWDIASQNTVNVNGVEVKMSIQDHHIIPLATSKNLLESTKELRNDKKNYFNSILNRTYILSKTNNVFSSNTPNKYLEELEKQSNAYMLNDHFIPDDYKTYFNPSVLNDQNNIFNFYKMRFEKIKTLIRGELANLKK